MHSSITNSFNFNSAYTTVHNYASIAYNKGVVWIKSTHNYLYPKIVEIGLLAKEYMSTGLQAGSTFLWSYKTFIIGGVVIGIALFVIHYHWKNRPQKPDVTLESTANVARLSIHVPKESKLPVNATLTFCVDLSSSMRRDGRNEAVKRALTDVLNNAQKVVNAAKEANIEIAIVGFNENPMIIAEKFKLLPLGNTEEVKKKINNLIFNGGTDTILGLGEATKQLESMARGNKTGSHTLILLTDGEETFPDKDLAVIHKQLALSKTELFAIGIGKDHNKETLGKITTSKEKGFRGTYFDTTGVETIESAVAKAYQQTVSSFHDLVLTTPNLPPDTWSVIDTPIVTYNEQSSCLLGPLATGKKLVKTIKIHGAKLPDSLDLSSVTFELSFTDPKGKKATVTLPWNPNTILNPEILAGLPVKFD